MTDIPEHLLQLRAAATQAWEEVKALGLAPASDIAAVQLDLAKRRFGKAQVAYENALDAFAKHNNL